MTTTRRYSFRSNLNPYSNDPPSIEIDQFDASPFSESFSGMIDEGGSESCTADIPGLQETDLSFNVEQISDIREIDPEWDDEEIEELIVLSPKMPNRLSTITEDLQELDRKANSIFTLSDFDLVFESEDETGTYLIRKRDTKQMYTMRRFKTTPSHMWPLELSVLEMINDREVPFLPKICWRVFEEGCFSLIMNFYPGGSLLSFVEQNGPLSRLHAMLYASELVEALSVVHAAGIQHRNITPACLMIDAGGHIVLVDFEHTFVDTEHVACTSGTVYCPNQDYEYRAPELLLGWTHDYAVDCWGFGCILYFMMYGLHPFPVNVDGFAWQEKVIRGQVSYNLDHAGLQVPRVARELMRACLEPNPTFRFDILEIKGHEFFACVNWSLVHEKNAQAPYVPPSDVTTKDKSESDISSETIHEPRSTASSTAPECSSSDWIAQTRTPASTATATPSMFSLKARQQVQEFLPSIFRIGNETQPDESKLLLSRSSTVATACSLDSMDTLGIECSSLPSPTPTYDSLRRHLDDTPSLTQEERMARFWESLDYDIRMKSPDVARCAGEMPYLPRSLVLRRSRNKLRKKSGDSAPRSGSSVSLSLVSSSTQRLSRLIISNPMSSSATTFPSSLRSALRKHKSSPMLVPPSSGSKLPQGVKQIGSGIGFTYSPPPMPLPLSVSIPVNDAMSRAKMKRPISGIGTRLKLRSKASGGRSLRWFAPAHKKGMTSDTTHLGVRDGKGRADDVAEVVIGRLSSSFARTSVQKLSLDSGRFRSSHEREPEHDVDVFRVGLLPGAVPEEIVSPVTETDSTVNNSPFMETVFLETQSSTNVSDTLMRSETLRGLFREHGMQKTLRLVL